MKYFVSVAGREIEVEVDGERVVVAGQSLHGRLERWGGTPVIQLVVDGVTHRLAVEGRTDGAWRLVDHGVVVEVEAVDERTRHIRSLAGSRRAATSGGVVRAPMPGLVVRVLVGEGDRVVAGQGLLVLEAMKMENELKAPADGVVSGIRVTAGATVEKGGVLVELGPLD